jgi:hypothetical protein
MRNARFKNPSMQKAYDQCRAAGADPNSGLWWNGKPSRGGATASAFWDGYDGIPCRYLRTSLAYAAWAAGRDHERKGR